MPRKREQRKEQSEDIILRKVFFIKAREYIGNDGEGQLEKQEDNQENS